MVKKNVILFLLGLFASVSLVFGEGKIDLEDRLSNCEAKLYNWEERINNLEEANSDLTRQLKEKESQFHLYEILLSKYENGHSSLITEFSIFVGVLSLVIGFFGYFAVIKPAQESKKEVDRLLERLQTNIDDLFTEYLKNNRNKLISNYLQVLWKKNEAETSNAIHYLKSVRHEGFNSEQLFKMRKIVLEDNDYTYQTFTNMIFTKDEIVENTCVEIFRKNLDNLISYALIYFAQHGIHEYDNEVVDYLNKEPNKWSGMIPSIRNASEDYLIKLWDNHRDEFTNESIEKIDSLLKIYTDSPLLNNKDKTLIVFLDKVKKSKFGKEKLSMT